MKNRKIISLVLALVLLLSCAVPVNAAEWNPNGVDSSIAEQIEENNKRVAQLWQKALSESTSEVYRMGDELLCDAPIPWASLKSATATHWHWYGFKIVDLIFKATFTTTTNAAGATVVDKVRTLTATGADDNTVVTVDDYSYTFIDSGRTIATTFSCTVGVWDSEDGYYSYFSQDYYVEFYVSGGGTVY